MNSNTTRRLTAVAAVLTVGVLAGCQDTGQVPGGGSAATPTSAPSKAPSGDSSSEGSRGTGGSGELKAPDLLSAPFPAMCDNPAGRLKEGKAKVGSGNVTLMDRHVSPGYNPSAGPVGLDLDNDGDNEMVAELECDNGGVTWPSVIVVYGDDWKILGSVDLKEQPAYKGQPMSKGRVLSWNVDGNALKVKWGTTDVGPVPTIPWTGRLVLKNGEPQLVDVARGAETTSL